MFQSVMDSALSGISKCAAYLDDVVISGITEVDCKSNLFLVLERFNKHNIKIKMKKMSVVLSIN